MRILVAVLLLQAATAQSDSRKMEEALKKFGDREYRIFEKGVQVGLCSLKTRVEGEGRARLAIFEDRIEKAGDAPLTLACTEKAMLSGLRLRWATRVDGGIKEDDPKVLIDNGEADITSAQGNMTIPKAEKACGERAIIRLLCMAEQKVGSAVQVDLLVLDPVDFQRKQEIKCAAAETIDVGGKKMAAFKWVDKREGKSILSGEEIPYKFDNAYWVGADGVLLKFTSGSMEMVLDSK